MRKLIIGLAGAAVLAMTLPAAAQVGVKVGEDGGGVRVGGHDRDRDRDRYRVRYGDREEWRERRHHRICDTVWRDHRRITVCRD